VEIRSLELFARRPSGSGCAWRNRQLVCARRARRASGSVHDCKQTVSLHRSTWARSRRGVHSVGPHALKALRVAQKCKIKVKHPSILSYFQRLGEELRDWRQSSFTREHIRSRNMAFVRSTRGLPILERDCRLSAATGISPGSTRLRHTSTVHSKYQDERLPQRTAHRVAPPLVLMVSIWRRVALCSGPDGPSCAAA
jgi:hypothetical protein